jgi:hypothetical protein
MKKTSLKVIEKIKNEDIKPKPAWYFYLVKILLYLITIVTIILGAFSLSLVSYLLINQDWNIVWPNFIHLIPYAWIFSLIIFYIIAYFNFKLFPRSYKYSKIQLLTFVLLSSILVAIFLNFANLPAKLHERACKKSHLYQRVFDSQTKPWHRPNEGFLSGKIINKTKTFLEIKDINNNIWTVNYNHINDLPTGTYWRFIGEKISDNEFNAHEIKHWLRKGRR